MARLMFIITTNVLKNNIYVVTKTYRAINWHVIVMSGALSLAVNNKKLSICILLSDKEECSLIEAKE